MCKQQVVARFFLSVCGTFNTPDIYFSFILIPLCLYTLRTAFRQFGHFIRHKMWHVRSCLNKYENLAIKAKIH